MVIYKITNQLNGKPYVGQTRQPIEKRFLQHAKVQTPLGDAMRQCGLENFTIEVVEECQSQKQLNSRERFWIRVLKFKVPNGYNQNDGGGVSIHKPRLSLMVGDNIKKLRETLGLTQQKLAERIGIKQNTIASAESNKRNLSRQALMSISREFGVRLEWLETGEGEMYATRDTSVIAQLEAAGCLTPKGRKLIEIYLQMPPDTQNLIADAIAAAAKYFRKETAQAEEPPARKPYNELTREEKHAMLDAELDAQEAAAKRGISTSVASTNFFGLVKNRGKPY